MISTSFIIGTGFIKCIPITFAGRVVTEAIFVIEIDEVFEQGYKAVFIVFGG